MTAEKKLAHQRLSLLELAEMLGSVSEACRRRGVSRTRFYEYKRRFQTHGIEGLKDLPPIAKHHPMSTPDAVVAQVLEIALEHPAWGCNRVSDWLSLQGVSFSPPTVQKLWNERGLGSRFERWLALESHVAERPLALTAEQVQFLEKLNPQWKERHVESSRPGELLCQDNFFVGHLDGVGKVYLQAVVDAYSSYAFGLLATSKQPETAALLLHNEVLPSYAARDIDIGAVLTGNGREFCGTEAHPY